MLWTDKDGGPPLPLPGPLFVNDGAFSDVKLCLGPTLADDPWFPASFAWKFGVNNISSSRNFSSKSGPKFTESEPLKSRLLYKASNGSRDGPPTWLVWLYCPSMTVPELGRWSDIISTKGGEMEPGEHRLLSDSQRVWCRISRGSMEGEFSVELGYLVVSAMTELCRARFGWLWRTLWARATGIMGVELRRRIPPTEFDGKHKQYWTLIHHLNVNYSLVLCSNSTLWSIFSFCNFNFSCRPNLNAMDM